MPEPLKRLKFVAQSSVAEYEIVDSRPMRSIVLRGLQLNTAFKRELSSGINSASSEPLECDPAEMEESHLYKISALKEERAIMTLQL